MKQKCGSLRFVLMASLWCVFGGCWRDIGEVAESVPPVEVGQPATNVEVPQTQHAPVQHPELIQYDEVDPPLGSVFRSTIKVRPNPIKRVPLVAIVEFETVRPVLAQVQVSDGARTWVQDSEAEPSRDHSVVVLGLRPDRRHELRVLVREPQVKGTESSPQLIFETAALPSDFPPLETTVSLPEQMEPGVTLFAVNIWRDSRGLLDYGYMIALDSSGEVVWYCRTGDRIADIRRTDSGTLIYQQGSYRYAYEIDLLGRDLNRWVATNLTERPDERSIGVPVDTMHHDLFEVDAETLMTLSTALCPFEKYPTSVTDANAPWEPAPVVCDEVIAFDRATGRIKKKIPLVELLDQRKFGYMALTGFWNDKYRPLLGEPARDWSHANALVPVPNEDAYLVSLRHLDCILKLNATTNQIDWILGDSAGWGDAWQPLFLKPRKAQGMEASFAWFYHQHSPQFTPQGTILLYDNGNFRAAPFRESVPASKNRSRVVEYRVDEATRTVQQVFSYDGGKDDLFYCPFYCEADWLPATGNVLVTDGGHIERADGTPSNLVPSERQWARIFEVTRSTPPRKVFEVVCHSPPESGLGWSIYRSNRFPDLYHDFRIEAPSKTENGNLFPRLPHVNRAFAK